MKQDNHDSDWEEISYDKCKDPAESTLSSNTEKDDLDNPQEVLYLNQVPQDKIIRTTRVPMLNQLNPADTVIARTSLPNLQHPAWAISPPLLKCQKSTTNILRESDVVPALSLPLSKAGADSRVPQLKAGGDHNVPHHQKAMVEVATRLMEANLFTKTSQPIISNETYLMVDEASQLANAAQDEQRAVAGVRVGTPSLC
jgi:hypothetical protein